MLHNQDAVVLSSFGLNEYARLSLPMHQERRPSSGYQFVVCPCAYASVSRCLPSQSVMRRAYGNNVTPNLLNNLSGPK